MKTKVQSIIFCFDVEFIYRILSYLFIGYSRTPKRKRFTFLCNINYVKYSSTLPGEKRFESRVVRGAGSGPRKCVRLMEIATSFYAAAASFLSGVSCRKKAARIHVNRTVCQMRWTITWNTLKSSTMAF